MPVATNNSSLTDRKKKLFIVLTNCQLRNWITRNAHNIIQSLSKYLFTRCWFDFLVFFPFFVFFFLFFPRRWWGIRCRFSHNFCDFLLVLNPRSTKNAKFSYFSWNESFVITQQLLVSQTTESLKSTTRTARDKRTKTLYQDNSHCTANSATSQK